MCRTAQSEGGCSSSRPVLLPQSTPAWLVPNQGHPPMKNQEWPVSVMTCWKGEKRLYFVRYLSESSAHQGIRVLTLFGSKFSCLWCKVQSAFPLLCCMFLPLTTSQCFLHKRIRLFSKYFGNAGHPHVIQGKTQNRILCSHLWSCFTC